MVLLALATESPLQSQLAAMFNPVLVLVITMDSNVAFAFLDSIEAVLILNPISDSPRCDSPKDSKFSPCFFSSSGSC